MMRIFLFSKNIHEKSFVFLIFFAIVPSFSSRTFDFVILVGRFRAYLDHNPLGLVMTRIDHTTFHETKNL